MSDISQSSLITPTIVLITGHFSNSAKFRGNVKIPRQRANFAAELEILRSTANCGPNNCGHPQSRKLFHEEFTSSVGHSLTRSHQTSSWLMYRLVT